MQPLPIDPLLPDLVAKLRASRRLVLVAPPGAGKTTRVPPAILAAQLLSPEHPNLVMLQPRRVAARAAAQRIADENHWQLGNEVGYHIRFEKRVQPTTRLRVLTEGILTRQLIADPFLEGIGAVLLDEFHERSLHTDIALALLKEIQSTVRPDLLIVVMSATLHAAPISAYLDHAPILESQGRLFPVTISHLGTSNTRVPLPDRIVSTLTNIFNSPNPTPGDILVFLPGAPEIHRTQKRLEPLATQHNLLVLPLHGTLPAADQIRALAPTPPPFRQKIILATNIAETSLTIEGVTTVIDSGLARVASYDPRRGLDRLELQRISRASATQRAGRAGRTAPGSCLRLWSATEDHHLAEFDTPEIRRVDLASTVLALHAWGKPDPRLFPWFEPPAEETLLAAEKLLTMLGAITPAPAAITPLGRQMLSLPIHPRLARLLIAAAEHNSLHEGCTLAALLSEKDILRSPQPGMQRAPTTQGPSDLLWRMELLAQTERTKFHHTDDSIDYPAARQIARTRDELLHLTRRLDKISPRVTPRGVSAAIPQTDYETRVLQLPLYAYPDRVVRRRPNDPTSGLMVGNIGVRLAPESIVRQADFYLALDARHDERNPAREATIRIASMIDLTWLQQLYPHEIRRTQSVTYDSEKDRVIPLNQLFYRDLLLEEDRHGNLNPTLAAATLLEAARPQIRELFTAHESAARLLHRLTFLKSAAPEQPWPPLTDDDLTEALTPLLGSKRSLADLRAAPLDHALRSLLHYPLDRLLDDLAPETIPVPSGSKIKIDYSPTPPAPPILAVRLQELFGLTQSPRIAAGRVPLLLHLLSPGYKPVQVTADLASFWQSAYFQVRKDLRTRYPKHAWPENPLAATPIAKGRPRK